MFPIILRNFSKLNPEKLQNNGKITESITKTSMRLNLCHANDKQHEKGIHKNAPRTTHSCFVFFLYPCA